MKSSRGPCRAVLLDNNRNRKATLSKSDVFEKVFIEGVFHKVLVAERSLASSGRQQLNIECLVRLRDREPLSDQEFLELLKQLGFTVKI